MRSYQQWMEEDQGTVKLSNKPSRGTDLWMKEIQPGQEVTVRLHPNDPYPSPGWKVVRMTDQAVVVQKSASFGGGNIAVGQTKEGSVGGTLVIPKSMFIQMIKNSGPNTKGFRQASISQQQVQSMLRRHI